MAGLQQLGAWSYLGTVRARRNPDICQTVNGVFVLAKILSVVLLELRPLGLRMGWIGHVLKADRI
jgi:hypothetical protein